MKDSLSRITIVKTNVAGDTILIFF